MNSRLLHNTLFQTLDERPSSILDLIPAGNDRRADAKPAAAAQPARPRSGHFARTLRLLAWLPFVAIAAVLLATGWIPAVFLIAVLFLPALSPFLLVLVGILMSTDQRR